MKFFKRLIVILSFPAPHEIVTKNELGLNFD